MHSDEAAALRHVAPKALKMGPGSSGVHTTMIAKSSVGDEK
jgi:hypothetical protein